MDLKNYPKKKSGMYILRNEDFDEIAEELLKEYNPSSLEDPSPLDIESFAEEDLSLTIKTVNITNDHSILGAISFDNSEFEICDFLGLPKKIELGYGEMLIDDSLMSPESYPRLRFTIAHECSHWELHRPYHSSDKRDVELRTMSLIACRENTIERFNYSGNNRDDKYWLELQADKLAAALLMPKNIFELYATNVMHKKGIRSKRIIFGEQKCKAIQVVEEIASQFKVSKRAAQIRMKQLGLLCE